MKKNYRIVVADDDDDDHFFITECLKKFNSQIELKSVYDGKQLLDLLLNEGVYVNAAKFEPDLILLDLNMPVLNGLETLKLLKSKKHLKGIPVYMLSTGSDSNIEKKAKNLGAEACYSKPNTFEEYCRIFTEIIPKL